MTINPGELDRHVTLLAPTPTPLPSGGFRASYTEIRKTWAKKTDVSGRSGAMSGREAASWETTFEMRYRGDVKDHWVVRYRDEDYEVQRVEEVGRMEGLRLWCKKKAQ